LFSTRIAYANPTTPENLRALAPRLTDAAALILPNEELDVVCFSCTSASVMIGDEVVEAAIQRAKLGVPVVTPGSAAVAAMRALGARRISVLTPYTVEVSEPMAAYFAAKGFYIESFTALGLDDDRRMAKLSRDTLIEAAFTATSPEADILFISCTALRSASVIVKIEAHIGRPVVTSNQASAWACLVHCGLPTPSGVGGGRLFEQGLGKGVVNGADNESYQAK
jgi:maleate isomerase